MTHQRQQPTLSHRANLGVEDLEEDDQYWMELVLNMDSLEESSGESQECWLLAIVTAREACRLRRRENEGEEESAGDEQPREGTYFCFSMRQAAWKL